VLSGLLGKDDQIDGDLVPALVAIGDAAAGQALVQAMDKLSGTVRMLAAGGVISLYDR
jgi:hypothetical protein